MYKISDYGWMINDRIRTDAYLAALRQTVKPGSVVVDIGAGTGIFSLLACQFGARKVYAIEPDDAIQLARKTVAANGFGDRVEFIQKMSTEAVLPEQADVIVSDIHAVLPMHERSLESILDARRRFLGSSGAVIPRFETLWAAVVDAPEMYKRCSVPWEDNAYGLNLLAGREVVTNTWWRGLVQPHQTITKPECWATLDYATLESPDVRGELTWTMETQATGHGIIAWFDSTLAEGVSFSNSPSSPSLVYGNAFFPLSTPIRLDVDDTVSISLEAKGVAGNYTWLWKTLVLEGGDPVRVKADFKQSTFFASNWSPDRLRRLAASHVPILNDEGRIDSLVLSLMNGSASSEDIAHQLTISYPKQFESLKDALTRVGELADQYSS